MLRNRKTNTKQTLQIQELCKLLDNITVGKIHVLIFLVGTSVLAAKKYQPLINMLGIHTDIISAFRKCIYFEMPEFQRGERPRENVLHLLAYFSY